MHALLRFQAFADRVCLLAGPISISAMPMHAACTDSAACMLIGDWWKFGALLCAANISIRTFAEGEGAQLSIAAICPCFEMCLQYLADMVFASVWSGIRCILCTQAEHTKGLHNVGMFNSCIYMAFCAVLEAGTSLRS